VAAREGILRQYKHSNALVPKTTAPVAFEGTQRINLKWLECCWLPSPDESKMSDALRAVCVQQLAYAWSCLIGIEGYGYDLPVSLLVIRRIRLILSPSKNSCQSRVLLTDG
jgi:hypothetical protein